MAYHRKYRILICNISTSFDHILILAFMFFMISMSAATYGFAFELDSLVRIVSCNQASLGSSKQLIVVTTDVSDSRKAWVFIFELAEKNWKNVYSPIEAVIGKRGFAEQNNKREGDKKTPSGIFHLGKAFGYNEAVDTRLQYRQATRNDYWVDDPGSPNYNQWVCTRPLSGTYERLYRQDNRYKYAIVIEYNMKPVIPGHGSAIFIHVWEMSRKGTAGCVAISEGDMIRLLSWLDIRKNPAIIMGTTSTLGRLEVIPGRKD